MTEVPGSSKLDSEHIRADQPEQLREWSNRQMNRPHLTRHATVRQQQRCIPPLVIDWLLSYGRRIPSFGAVMVRFDRQGRKELAREVGFRVVSVMSKYLNVALVVDPDTDRVITVEWLH
jgi:hypothetical protein